MKTQKLAKGVFCLWILGQTAKYVAEHRTVGKYLEKDLNMQFSCSLLKQLFTALALHLMLSIDHLVLTKKYRSLLARHMFSFYDTNGLVLVK